MVETAQAALYRVDIHDADRLVLAAVVPSSIAIYRAPPWVQDRVAGGALRWRVVALDINGQEIGVSTWRTRQLSPTCRIANGLFDLSS